ncbi:MAG: HAD hydrolase-like protein [Dehalococcoidales bacterium]|nr:MAG: HAD hydrolase-like protein [Dehalococcoidales bacterium]
MLKNLLFDLDGTISDSREGVIGCFQHTLKVLTGSYAEESVIMKLIGIPIHTIFSKLLQTDDEQLITRAISVYRDKFAEIGITGNSVYPGITELLSSLDEESYSIYIVTMKNTQDSEKVIRHLGFDHLIRRIYGSDLEGYPDNKAELIKSALNENNLSQDETVMIGDRKEDVLAGKSNNIWTIGVTWGFGSIVEIAGASPDRICHSAEELLPAIKNLQD